MRNRVSALALQTPEGITFRLLPASPVTRSLAWAIDAFCIMTCCYLMGVAGAFLAIFSVDLMQGVILISYFVISVGYGMVLEWFWRGQTIGKRFLRLRVVDSQGLRLQESQVIIRNLLRFVDSLPVLYLIGGVTALLNPHGKRLGDLAANTLVIREPLVKEPDLDQILGGKFNSLRNHPHLIARLRQRITLDESRLVLEALLRREELDPARRLVLYRELAEHIQGLVRFPEEIEQGLSHEQFLRNIVDVLYKKESQEMKPALKDDPS